MSIRRGLLCLLLLATPVWAEESLDSQLLLVQTRKGMAQSEIDRGRLMVENGQMWLEKFTAQEKEIQAKLEAQKKPESASPGGQ